MVTLGTTLQTVEGDLNRLDDVLRYTNGDRFTALDGYKTLSTHWHLAEVASCELRVES